MSDTVPGTSSCRYRARFTLVPAPGERRMVELPLEGETLAGAAADLAARLRVAAEADPRTGGSLPLPLDGTGRRRSLLLAYVLGVEIVGDDEAVVTERVAKAVLSVAGEYSIKPQEACGNAHVRAWLADGSAAAEEGQEPRADAEN